MGLPEWKIEDMIKFEGWNSNLPAFKKRVDATIKNNPGLTNPIAEKGMNSLAVPPAGNDPVAMQQYAEVTGQNTPQSSAYQAPSLEDTSLAIANAPINYAERLAAPVNQNLPGTPNNASANYQTPSTASVAQSYVDTPTDYYANSLAQNTNAQLMNADIMQNPANANSIAPAVTIDPVTYGPTTNANVPGSTSTGGASTSTGLATSTSTPGVAPASAVDPKTGNPIDAGKWGMSGLGGTLLGAGQLGVGLLSYFDQRKTAKKQRSLMDQQIANNAYALDQKKNFDSKMSSMKFS